MKNLPAYYFQKIIHRIIQKNSHPLNLPLIFNFSLNSIFSNLSYLNIQIPRTKSPTITARLDRPNSKKKRNNLHPSIAIQGSPKIIRIKRQKRPRPYSFGLITGGGVNGTGDSRISRAPFVARLRRKVIPVYIYAPRVSGLMMETI